MADIPFAVRKAAKDYIEHVDFMERTTTARGSAAWQKLDKERSKLHDRFYYEWFKVEGPGREADLEAAQVPLAIVRRSWRAKKSGSVKARRPPQTMADIPYSLRAIAKKYIEHIDEMREWIRRNPAEWQRMDRIRSKYHTEFLNKCLEIGTPWMEDTESEKVAFAIVRRRWKAEGWKW